MKVVFLQNIKGIAQIGDIKDVSDGHARNFLFPKKMAKPAVSNAIKEAGVLIKKREQGETLRKEMAQKLAQELQNVAFEIKEDANEEGHLYGSVNEKTIAVCVKAGADLLAVGSCLWQAEEVEKQYRRLKELAGQAQTG